MMRFSMRSSQPVPSRQGVHWPQDSDIVEARQPLERPHHAGGLVHDDDGAGADRGAGLLDRVVVHVGRPA